MLWAEVAGRVLALGDAAPVAEVVAHWAVEPGLAITVYRREELHSAARVDQLVRAADGTLRRTEAGRELVERGGDAGWLEAIGAGEVAESIPGP